MVFCHCTDLSWHKSQLLPSKVSNPVLGIRWMDPLLQQAALCKWGSFHLQHTNLSVYLTIIIYCKWLFCKYNFPLLQVLWLIPSSPHCRGCIWSILNYCANTSYRLLMSLLSNTQYIINDSYNTTKDSKPEELPAIHTYQHQRLICWSTYFPRGFYSSGKVIMSSPSQWLQLLYLAPQSTILHN